MLFNCNGEWKYFILQSLMYRYVHSYCIVNLFVFNEHMVFLCYKCTKFNRHIAPTYTVAILCEWKKCRITGGCVISQQKWMDIADNSIQICRIIALVFVNDILSSICVTISLKISISGLILSYLFVHAFVFLLNANFRESNFLNFSIFSLLSLIFLEFH